MDGPLAAIRSEHTGSLPRPTWLREIQVGFNDGSVSVDELAAANQTAIDEVLSKQAEIGLPVLTDGELSRRGFQESFGGAVSGYDSLPFTYSAGQSAEAQGSGQQRIPSGMPSMGPAVVHRRPTIERLQLARNIIKDEYLVASALTDAPVKVTLIGPDRISQRFEYESSKDVYSGMDEFLGDVVAIERQMIAEVVDAGCRYIQIDEPGYTAYVDPVSLDTMRARGENPEANLERSIAADNEVIRDFPGVTFGVHICRGAGGGRGGAWFHREGSYDAIAEQLYGGLNFDRYLLEYDSEAAGSFESLRFVPEGKIVVLGLFSNHADVETADFIKRRLDEASRFLPLDRAALCPRCGFGGSAEATVWGKLAVQQEVADEVWGS